ncbi:diguanylate cyclase (GGDEF) domain-containing protein [Alteromonadaceae bacterium Bs31]|nr:diguanylate cyclase (GGDEF) domain-containing protein [Alteromonadaceae bacterium Bs31]
MSKLEEKKTYLFLLMIVLSLALILAYQLLPNRTLTLAPGSVFGVYASGDAEFGGSSTAHFLNEGSSQWRCTLRKGVKAPEFPSCRIGISFSRNPDDWTQGKDFSDFDYLRIQLDYKGPATFFRAHFRNFDTELSRKEDYNSAKFVKLIIRDPGVNSDYRFALSEFKLADWWIQHYSVPNHRAKAAFDRVTSFELDFGEPVPYGEHAIELKSIQLVGKYASAENWYLSILVCWMVVMAIVGLLRLRHLNLVSKAQGLHLEQMSQYAQELKQQSLNYKTLSSYDPLTGVLNRLGLQDILDSSFQWRKESNHIALLLLDLDHFKNINDTKGHDAGDQVLKATGKMLEENTRSVDTVARWGGEEFIILCPNTGREAAMVLAEKIRIKITELDFSEYKLNKITASLGVTIINFDEPFDRAFSRVDKALYDAKNSGRNCWVYT